VDKLTINNPLIVLTRCSAIVERLRCAAGCVIVVAKSGTLELGDNINFVADFLQAKCDFRRKSAVLRF